MEVGRVLEDEGRMAIAADQEIAQRSTPDGRQQRENERSPEIVLALPRAHEAGEAEGRRSDQIQQKEPGRVDRLRKVMPDRLRQRILDISIDARRIPHAIRPTPPPPPPP